MISECFYFNSGNTIAIELVQDREPERLEVVHSRLLVRQRSVLGAESHIVHTAEPVVEHGPVGDGGRAFADVAQPTPFVQGLKPLSSMTHEELVPCRLPLVDTCAQDTEVETCPVHFDKPAHRRDRDDIHVARTLGAVTGAVRHHAHFVGEGELGVVDQTAHAHVQPGGGIQRCAVLVEFVQNEAGLVLHQVDRQRGHRNHAVDLLYVVQGLEVHAYALRHKRGVDHVYKPGSVHGCVHKSVCNWPGRSGGHGLVVSGLALCDAVALFNRRVCSQVDDIKGQERGLQCALSETVYDRKEAPEHFINVVLEMEAHA